MVGALALLRAITFLAPPQVRSRELIAPPRCYYFGHEQRRVGQSPTPTTFRAVISTRQSGNLPWPCSSRPYVIPR